MPQYRSYGIHAIQKLPQLAHLTAAQRFEMRVVAAVLPFKVSSYVVDLIDWQRVPHDPVFQLTFPQPGMLSEAHYYRVAALLQRGADARQLRAVIAEIRQQLNPHPGGQLQLNVPRLDGSPVSGVQHKYRETVLFFPRESQTCHAYCSYCFRWPQFIGDRTLRFESEDTDRLISYLRRHPEVTDVLFTGGDPMIMPAALLARYIEPLLQANLPGLRTIRIGTKALAYWPYRFTEDQDADQLMRLFARITAAGIHAAVMAHFNHRVELSTRIVQHAIARLRSAGCEIRTQAPLVRRVNDSAVAWADMLRDQVGLGCIPYYMFILRDTGSQHYFAVPLLRALDIHRGAIAQVSGLARTLRGPTMSTAAGKVELLDRSDVGGRDLLTLRMVQARHPRWTGRVFFAEANPRASWLSDLKPAFGAPRFFFEEDPRRALPTGPGPTADHSSAT